jgi:AbrB family looped-hinge helix DNA binding protein
MPHTTIGFLTIDQKGRATFPRELRRELGLTENSQLRIDRTEDGTYELVPAEVVPRDQLWYHAPEGRARIEGAEEDFRSGRSTRTRGLDETQRHLDALKQRTDGRSSSDG